MGSRIFLIPPLKKMRMFRPYGHILCPHKISMQANSTLWLRNYSGKPTFDKLSQTKTVQANKREPVPSVYAHTLMHQKNIENIKKRPTVPATATATATVVAAANTPSIPAASAGGTPTWPAPSAVASALAAMATAKAQAAKLPSSFQKVPFKIPAPIEPKVAMKAAPKVTFNASHATSSTAAPVFPSAAAPKPALKVSVKAASKIPNMSASMSTPNAQQKMAPKPSLNVTMKAAPKPAKKDLAKEFAKLSSSYSSTPKPEMEFETSTAKNYMQAMATLNREIKAVRDVNEDLLKKFKAAVTDSENMRMRLQKQITDAKKYGIQNLCKDLLDVLDTLGQAVESVPREQIARNSYIRNLFEGVSLTKASMLQTFKRYGIETINPINEKFNPNFHEALFIRDQHGADSDTVVVVSKLGYKLHERLLRPALVGVAKSTKK